ncbi:MAG TPA: hypothetical protein VH592_07795 [Gemmataceae bacterium]|jgi:septal ring factor EnvC (AmiA/AmiB activator)
MSEPSLLDLFCSRCLEIAREIWPATPREQLESELASVDAELSHRQSRLLFCRRRIEKLHDRLKRRENRLARLAASVQKIPTDASLIEVLERIQRGNGRLRERLQALEHGYARRLERFRQKKQKWSEFRERLLSGSLRKPEDEKSDPDYPF